MSLNWKTFSFAIASVAVLIFMTEVVVVSQGTQTPQTPQAPQGPWQRGGFRRGPGGPGDGMLPMMRDLNLTDDQKAQIKKIMESDRASTKDLRDKLMALHQSEPDPLSTNFDEATVRASAQARASIDVEMQVAHARTMSQ